MDNMNPETMNNIKNLVDNGNISEAISHISPEMIEHFSKMLNSNTSNNSNNSNNHNNSDLKNNNNSSQTENTYNSNNSNSSNFNFNNIDMNTILKMKSAMDKMNNKNDPRSNLLYSLKPYLRQNKQEKLDQYVNLLNFSKIADILKNDKKDDTNV